ncbi:MAG: hypothetical protein PVI09_19030, partial [Anaerolineae bacterium]
MTIETKATTLIHTKLQRPRLPGDHVRRRRQHASLSRARALVALALLFMFVLTGPLTVIHANGAPAGLTEEEQTEQPPPLQPEQVRFDHITTEDGLSENRVWGITQDRRGFLWFTSVDGINRYDGHEFKVYKPD